MSLYLSWEGVLFLRFSVVRYDCCVQILFLSITRVLSCVKIVPQSWAQRMIAFKLFSLFNVSTFHVKSRFAKVTVTIFRVNMAVFPLTIEFFVLISRP